MQPSAWLANGGFLRANNCNVFEKNINKKRFISTKETNFARSCTIFELGSRKDVRVKFESEIKLATLSKQGSMGVNKYKYMHF